MIPYKNRPGHVSHLRFKVFEHTWIMKIRVQEAIFKSKKNWKCLLPVQEMNSCSFARLMKHTDTLDPSAIIHWSPSSNSLVLRNVFFQMCHKSKKGSEFYTLHKSVWKLNKQLQISDIRTSDLQIWDIYCILKTQSHFSYTHRVKIWHLELIPTKFCPTFSPFSQLFS